MNETIEEQLRRVLAQSATAEVPDALPIPPLRQVDELTVRRRRRLVPVISGIAAAAIITLIATAALLLHTNQPDESVSAARAVTPQLVGLSLVEAEADITAAGLTVGTLTSVESAGTPKGQVIAQQPSGGTVSVKGDLVDLQVSAEATTANASALITVPDLRASTATEATAQLTKLYLVIKVVIVPSTGGKKGHVVRQDPEPNAKVSVGTVVTVTVTDPNFTDVPQGLVGMTYDQAVATLKSVKLTAIPALVDSTQPVNTVVGVKVAVGTSVVQGSPIALQISNNQLFIVPKLANLTSAEAIAKLASLGWTGSASSLKLYTTPTSDRMLVGKIAGESHTVITPKGGGGTVQMPGQAPPPGTPVRKSTSFTIIVYVMK